MLNIVIPMAGRGSRFSQAGYTLPKPLIPIHGVPMIELVIDNLRPSLKHRFIFICQRDHIEKFDLSKKFDRWVKDAVVIGIDGITEGAAVTVLKAKDLIDSDDELMIANSDQFVDLSIDYYIDALHRNNLDGLIMTMRAHDPKWSFVGFSEKGEVDRVVEKEVISDEATVGIYNFRRGSDFVNGALRMINKNIRVNGEYYVAPVYNQLIENGAKLGVFNIGKEGEGMYGLGTPEDLEDFLNLPISYKASRRLRKE
ncbi:MAG: glycosyltransferase family 2 protein [Oxalobacter formigenes]|nr:glycosyltransferase family 2 protein [Oxalobacter formigenes]